MATQNMTLGRQTYSVGDIFKAALVAVAVSSVANVVLWLLAVAVGLVPGDFWVLQPVSIIASTLAFTLIGAAVLAVLTRVSRNPMRTWRIVAIAGLVLSFSNPFMLLTGSMPGFPVPTASTVAVMLLMHVIAGVSAIYFMTTMPKPKS
ncbi:MAG: DUF6069 family protein [Chloroflexota bacterium]|nr:DUF6069 family protein [Chloroflexota bacterium]MDQ5865088.1 DUF6069 family protein [Chloroflexota bacterium]